MRFILYMVAILTAINIMVLGTSWYILKITLNSYEYVERKQVESRQIDFTPLPPYPELTIEEQEWIDTYAPLIDIEDIDRTLPPL